MDDQPSLKSIPFEELPFEKMDDETVCSTHLRSQSGARDEGWKELDQNVPASDQTDEQVTCIPPWTGSIQSMPLFAGIQDIIQQLTSLNHRVSTIWRSAMVPSLSSTAPVLMPRMCYETHFLDLQSFYLIDECFWMRDNLMFFEC